MFIPELNPHQHQEEDDRQMLLREAIDLLCDPRSLATTKKDSPSTTPCNMDNEEVDGSTLSYWEDNDSDSYYETEDLMARVQSLVLQGGAAPMMMGDESSLSHPPPHHERIPSCSSSGASTTTTPDNKNNTPALWKELQDCFTVRDDSATRADRQAEFQSLQDFVESEERAGRIRRMTARQTEAQEEERLALEVAQFKSSRFATQKQQTEHDLQWKMNHAERAYTSRKMVFAKAGQVAGTELRLQFARVRSFLERLHAARREALVQKHRRTMQFQTLLHTLRGTDARVVSLDRQILVRSYQTQKAHLNEYHMAQTLEEAVYLEEMMNRIDQVQQTKERAAKAMYECHVQHLKQCRFNREQRQEECALFEASATLELAKLVAQYAQEGAEDREHDAQVLQHVNAMERSKLFASNSSSDKENNLNHANNTTTTTTSSVSIGKLYDTVVWGVATNNLGLTSTSGSSLYSSEFGSDIMDEYDGNHDDDDEDYDNSNSSSNNKHHHHHHHKQQLQQQPEDNDDNSSDEDNHHDPSGTQSNCMTPTGRMHYRQLARVLKIREKTLLFRHQQEIKAERKDYLIKSRALKAKHQEIIDEVIESSRQEQDALRNAINDRMEALAVRQDALTEQMRKKDSQLMREALFAEDQRVQEAETASFRKAQEFISAQVFHEVRNALSAVIAMSEMTDTLKTDPSLAPHDLVGSVDKMLDQIGDVVNYSLKMLNEILDVSKINSGAFIPKKEPFDLQKVVSRATRMQQAKASKIKLSFQPWSSSPSSSLSLKQQQQPCIAISDSGIVERIIATMISNAVKFTRVGAVQPFIWPLENMMVQQQPPPQKVTTTTTPSCMIEAAETGSEQSEPSSSIDGSQPSRTTTTVSRASMSSSSSCSDGESSTSTSTTTTMANSSSTMANSSTSTTRPGESNHSIMENNNNNNGNSICDDQLQLANSNIKWVAVGVADTGAGLSDEILQSAKFVISTATSRSSSHGAQNTGFGLYHGHLQTRALDTHLQLSSLEDCRDLLNDDMQEAVTRRYQAFAAQQQQQQGISGATNDNNMEVISSGSAGVEIKECEVPGRGTVLYFTLPVYEDGEAAAKALQKKKKAAYRTSEALNRTEYKFRPLPSPKSRNKCFRILVADDVLMLRKGMVHIIGKLWSKHFPHCPVSVSTACTAEDVLRAAALEPFDMIICDHHFCIDKSKVKAFLPSDDDDDCVMVNGGGGGGRPCVTYDETNATAGEIRNDVKSFFDNERFTIEEDDGALLGLDALIQIAKSPSSLLPFPTPMLMLVSGHTIDIDPELGILVALKPLKHSDFISSLEAHAVDLLGAGLCHESSRGDISNPDKRDTLVNGHGSQLFVRAEDDPS